MRNFHSTSRKVSGILATALLYLSCVKASAGKENYLNTFLLTAPPKYLAGIPKSKREQLISFLSGVPHSQLLDYPNAWVTYTSDNPYMDVSPCRFWIKLLKREDGRAPLVFVFAPKRATAGGRPTHRETYILEADSKVWRDITTRYIPHDVDLTMAFLPLRRRDDILVANYQLALGNPRNLWGQPYYWFYVCRLILHWNGASFEERTIKPQKVDNFDAYE